jgi:hypothetical protein
MHSKGGEMDTMEFYKKKSFKAVAAVYWTAVFAVAAFGYWLIISTLF